EDKTDADLKEKDFGISNAGSVPNSKLAAQDLETDSSETKKTSGDVESINREISKLKLEVKDLEKEYTKLGSDIMNVEAGSAEEKKIESRMNALVKRKNAVEDKIGDLEEKSHSLKNKSQVQKGLKEFKTSAEAVPEFFEFHDEKGEPDRVVDDDGFLHVTRYGLRAAFDIGQDKEGTSEYRQIRSRILRSLRKSHPIPGYDYEDGASDGPVFTDTDEDEDSDDSEKSYGLQNGRTNF
ncbi:MAG: hypothetical protein ACYDBV_13945, partial [Nitrospiria bacterium]